jgi:hypothetical protein
MKVNHWRKFERHPLSADYAELTGDEFEEMLDKFEKFGNIDNRPITLDADPDDGGKMKILDGWNLYRCHVEKNVKPRFVQRNAKISPIDYVEIKNDVRRHETRETIEKRAEVRRQRVVELREKGESIRAIAGKVGVDPRQVQRDLEAAAESAPAKKKPKGAATVTGRDGKTYERETAVSQIRCDRCKRTGQTKPCPACEDLRTEARYNAKHPAREFDWHMPDRALEAVAAVPEAIGKFYSDRNSTEYHGAKRLITELHNLFAEWRKRVKSKVVA